MALHTAIPILVGAVAIGAFGCGDKAQRDKPISRDRDAAAVVVVKGSSKNVSFTDEVEPNNTAQQAAQQAPVLAVPGGVHGTLATESDIDRYAIDVEQAGWLAVEVGGIQGVDLIVELQSAKGTVVARSDRGPAETSEGLPNYWVEPGRYLVAVSEFVKRRRKKSKRPRTTPSPTYPLSVALTTAEPNSGHEREPNQEPTTVAEVQLGTDVFGYVGWRDDRDLWRLTFDGFPDGNGLDVDVAPVPGVRLQVRVLDDNGDQVVRRRGAKGEAVAVRALVPKRGDDHHYVEISGRGSNPVDRYALRLSGRPLELQEEREPNDDKNSAAALRQDAMESAGSLRGHLLAGDEDWFAFKASAPTLLSVTVKPPAGVDVSLSLVSSAGVLGEANAGASGAEEALSGRVSAGQKVYLRVHGKGTAETVEVYELVWSTGPAGAATPESDYDPSDTP